MKLDLLIPDWPLPPNVRAAFTTRAGGVSQGAYASLNLGQHVGDAPEHVAANRAALHASLGVRPVFLNQVHGVSVLHLDAATPDGFEADACVTEALGTACTVMVADCLPVLLARADGSAVAAAHAGWRGLAGGVIEATVLALAQRNSEPNSPAAQLKLAAAAIEIIAWMGPCIGPSAFEVGAEVKAAFVAGDPCAGQFFRPAGDKFFADLAGLARQRLRAAGVTRISGNDSSSAWCTVGNPDRFFSHRASAPTGRMAACVWRV